MKYNKLPISDTKITHGDKYHELYTSQFNKITKNPSYLLEFQNTNEIGSAKAILFTKDKTHIGDIYMPPKTYDMTDVNLEPIFPSTYELAQDYIYNYDKGTVTENINQYQYDKVKESLLEQYDANSEFYSDDIDTYMKHYKDFLTEKNPTLDIQSEMTLDLSGLDINELSK